MKTVLYFFYRRKENEFELERFFPAPAIYSLLLENLEMIQRCIGYVNIRDVEKKVIRDS